MSRGYRSRVRPAAAFRNNVAVGAALGAGAYVVNYVLIYLFMMIDGVELGEEGWRAVGNVLYNAQFVDTEVSVGGQSVSFNLVTGESSNALFTMAMSQTKFTSTIPGVVYHAAPILIMAVAGAVAVTQAGSRMDIEGAAASAASIVPGALTLSLVGIFLFEDSRGNGSMAPELVTGVLLVGILIPLVGSVVGGVVANKLRA